MERTPLPVLHPALLPAGTVLGRWRVVAWGGQGVHGAVYRAVPVGQQQAPAVALKVALHPKAPRMEREAQLLSRLRHPSIPRPATATAAPCSPTLAPATSRAPPPSLRPARTRALPSTAPQSP